MGEASPLISLISSFFITYYAIPWCIYAAQRLAIVDAPDGIVKMHRKTTPYLGGIAVFLGFITGLVLSGSYREFPLSFLLGMILLLVVGLVDDITVLKPNHKLFGQLCAVLVIFSTGVYTRASFFSTWWLIPFSLLWTLTLVNAINLIDIMDGLAAVVSGSAALNMAIIAYVLQQPTIAAFFLSMVGALIGFFCYNRPPARIYLGDAGALFIGGFLASAPFLIGWSVYQAWGFVAPIIILAIPLLEVVSLIIIRTAKRLPFWLPSKDHFKCFLERKGWRVEKILWFMIFMSFILGISSLFFVLNIFNKEYTFVIGVLYFLAWLWVIYR